MALPEYPAKPHEAKVAKLRAAIKALEAHEEAMLAEAEAAYAVDLEAECAAEAYDAKLAAEALAAHLPARH